MAPLAPEELTRLLAREGAALAALGRALLGGDLAEDVVQEAALAALHDPPSGERPGAWLQRVVRNVAATWSTRERPRQRRERAAARAEALPGAADVAAASETLRRVATLRLAGLPVGAHRVQVNGMSGEDSLAASGEVELRHGEPQRLELRLVARRRR